MKLVNPTIKYKESYLNLIKAAQKNGDCQEEVHICLPPNLKLKVA